MFPQSPSIEGIDLKVDPAQEYAIIVSMYEVYNDRIFDLLVGTPASAKLGTMRRRPLLFKSTELSPDRKIVAGLRKIVCSSLDEALMVLESGLIERKVAGTGSNAVSSRSHGFFCVDVKRRNRTDNGRWEGSTLTIVDLAGSWQSNVNRAKSDGFRIRASAKRKDGGRDARRGRQDQREPHVSRAVHADAKRQPRRPQGIVSSTILTAHILTTHSRTSSPSANAS
jgi:hypothetical protein